MNRIIGISGALGLALPGSLAAQDSALPDRLDPDEIVVTGERIPRLEMETASSVAVLSSADLEASSADRLDQILALVPNVQLGSGEEGPAIRGQDSTGQLRNLFAFFGAARPRVTLQVDGRPVSFYEFISGSQSIWDVKQVEVFRSPQTTTQGRNSIAGAIFVTTQIPTEQWEGRGRVIVGDESMQQFSAALSGPIVKEELAFRLSGDLRLAEVTNDMTDGVVGANIDRDEFGTARLKFLYQPATLASARVETTLAYTQSQSPQFEGASRPFDERRLPIPNQMIGVMKVRATSLTTRADYEVAQGLQGALTVSYGDAVLRRFGLPGLGRARADTNDLSIEPTLLWDGSDDFSLLVGANRYAMDQVQTIDISGFGLGTGTFKDQQDSLGLFGEATWHPVAFIAVTGGLRYEEDRQARVGGIGGILLDFDRTFDALLPKFAIAFNQGEDLSIGLMAQRAFNPGGVAAFIGAAAQGYLQYETARLAAVPPPRFNPPFVSSPSTTVAQSTPDPTRQTIYPEDGSTNHGTRKTYDEPATGCISVVNQKPDNVTPGVVWFSFKNSCGYEVGIWSDRLDNGSYTGLSYLGAGQISERSWEHLSQRGRDRVYFFACRKKSESGEAINKEQVGANHYCYYNKIY